MEWIKELNDILLDDCDFNCAQTHDEDTHEALRETRKERLHVLITTQITKARNEALSEAIVAVLSINGKIPDPIVNAIRALKTTI